MKVFKKNVKNGQILKILIFKPLKISGFHSRLCADRV